MNDKSNVWALVLAAGEGSRLRTLTTTANGTAVPKQFCSLRGGSSLLQDALQRAHSVAPAAQVCSIVAGQHRRWWSADLRSLSADSVIVQPENRGTANGILLPLLHIAARDPDATLVLLPADHHVRDEAVLAAALRKAAALAQVEPQTVYLLGIEPDCADSELGYIVPRGTLHASAPVREFVEKPALPLARELLMRGALWNSFIIAASARALLALYRLRCDDVLAAMNEAVQADRIAGSGAAIAAFYQDLRSLDFSRDILQGGTDSLRVVRVPECGWTDLGTPQRVAATLQGMLPVPELEDMPNEGGGLSLAAQHWRLNSRRQAGLYGVRP
jgi:mannose-1-phosphate guanylyltransferase